MCGVYNFASLKPKIGRNVYIDPLARVIGDVTIGDESAILFGAIVRADSGRVIIGKKVAILENVIIEAPGGYDVIIGDNTIISHGAIIHGAQIGSRCLIGIGAIVLDGAKVCNESIVASGALVPPGKIIESRKLVMGIPGKVVRDVVDDDLKRLDMELEEVMNKKKEYFKIFSSYSELP